MNDNNLLKKLSECSSATVHEALGRIGAVDCDIKPITRGMKVCGPAYTVTCHTGDNLMLHQAIVMAKPGDVIVAQVGNYKQFGVWGEITSTACMVRGINGFVTDGSVRDVNEITELGFPVFSRGICIKGTVKETRSAINEPISFGDVVVNPGDFVLGDDNGIVIIPKHLLNEAVKKSQEREEKEKGFIEKLKKVQRQLNF